MVFFTCNACGQSIKKNKVEKHWQMECPRCEVLSCLDCGRDFTGDEYISHTSCITEAEKYQGDLYKGEKGGISKGEKKQKDWVEQLTQSIGSGSHPPHIAVLVKRILQYSNIPRKKAKFENFVKNSINVHDKVILNTLWDIFHQPPQHSITTKIETEEDHSPVNKNSLENKKPIIILHSTVESHKDDQLQVVKKGKKRKHQEDIEITCKSTKLSSQCSTEKKKSKENQEEIKEEIYLSNEGVKKHKKRHE